MVFGSQNQQMGNQALEAVGMIAEMQENMLDAEIHKLDNLDGKGFGQNTRGARQTTQGTEIGRGRVVAPRPRAFDAAHGDEGVLRCVEELEAVGLPFYEAYFPSLRRLERSFGQDGFLHRETRFCTFDAEKSPYLCDKILADPEGNVVIPTLLLVKEGKVTYHIRGLAELGGEQCNCEIMAAVLQIHGLIEGEAAKHEYDDGQPTFGSVEGVPGA